MIFSILCKTNPLKHERGTGQTLLDQGRGLYKPYSFLAPAGWAARHVTRGGFQLGPVSKSKKPPLERLTV